MSKPPSRSPDNCCPPHLGSQVCSMRNRKLVSTDRSWWNGLSKTHCFAHVATVPFRAGLPSIAQSLTVPSGLTCHLTLTVPSARAAFANAYGPTKTLLIVICCFGASGVFATRKGKTCSDKMNTSSLIPIICNVSPVRVRSSLSSALGYPRACRRPQPGQSRRGSD